MFRLTLLLSGRQEGKVTLEGFETVRDFVADTVLIVTSHFSNKKVVGADAIQIRRRSNSQCVYFSYFVEYGRR